VRVGVLFHAINAWAPPAPNNIASFSLVCLVRLVTFAPKAAADALHFTMRNNSALICAGVAALLGAAGCRVRDARALHFAPAPRGPGAAWLGGDARGAVNFVVHATREA